MKCERQPEILLPETGLMVREEVIFTDQGEESDLFLYTVTTERNLELTVEDKKMIDQAGAVLQIFKMQN
jgi:hypothetical protein